MSSSRRSQQSRNTRSSRQANPLPGLTVYFPGEGRTRAASLEYQVLDDRSPLYLAVRNIANLGLIILEAGRGRIALMTLARALILENWQLEQPCLYPRNDSNLINLGRTIDLFLSRVRQGFPNIYVTHTSGEAATAREDWADEDSTLESYDARLAGTMYLHRQV
jgi:hypothetical protein